jgi:hypothetical protein
MFSIPNGSIVASRTESQATGLWEPPAAPATSDLFNGTWGAKYAPDPAAVYTFVRNKEHGVNPGVVVRDPAGRVWHVKQSNGQPLGDEGPVEVTLSRVLAAVGYHQPPVYFLPSFTMADPNGKIHREDGGRFRLDDGSMRDLGEWSWEENPFIGSRPFQGLLVMLVMFNSWDLKDSNNAVYEVQRPNGRVDQLYVVRDLGGALGGSGTLHPKRNNVEKFERFRFISGVENGVVSFDYDGKKPELIRKRITIDDARWAGDLLGALSDRQWHDAFRAGGYTPAISDRFIRKIQDNIAQARSLGRAAPRSAQGRR